MCLSMHDIFIYFTLMNAEGRRMIHGYTMNIGSFLSSTVFSRQYSYFCRSHNYSKNKYYEVVQYKGHSTYVCTLINK